MIRVVAFVVVAVRERAQEGVVFISREEIPEEGLRSLLNSAASIKSEWAFHIHTFLQQHRMDKIVIESKESVSCLAAKRPERNSRS